MSSKEVRLLFVGFGKAGRGCARHLLSQREFPRVKSDFQFRVVGIVDILKGSILNEKGIDLSTALSLIQRGKSLEGSELKGRRGLAAIDAIISSNADIMIEATWTNLKDAEPATSHIITALKSGIDVATSNKGPLALHFKELTELANSEKRFLRYESTVMSGTPVFNMKEFCLPGAKITKIRGILNGTTNYILTEMANGKSYESSLRAAQKRGYAEVDPTGDVDAHDSAAKITILANALLNLDVTYNEVTKSGITKITADDIQEATSRSKRIKLLAEANTKQEGRNKYKISVKPTLLSVSDLLAHVDGVMNALELSMNVQPDVTVVGPGAGGDSAGFGLLSDILSIHDARNQSAKLN